MLYFDKFPYTTFQENNSSLFVRDFIRAIDLTFTQDDETNLFEDYYLQDGEKIEHVAYSFYGSTEYHWVLVYINDIKDIHSDLPQRDQILREAASEIYGNLDEIHHYENSENPGEWVDLTHPTHFPVTNMEYMTNENEKKRKIKVLRPIYLTDFVKLYMQEVQT